MSTHGDNVPVTVTAVMTGDGVTPPDLYPGPVVEGVQTYYGTLAAVPEDWQWTHHTEATSQEKAYTARGNESGRIVQCWKPCDPEPQWLFVDGMKRATWADLHGRICGVTTVGEMLGRADLGQWEYADNDPQSVGWTKWADMGWNGAPDDLPVIVRRIR